MNILKDNDQSLFEVNGHKATKQSRPLIMIIGVGDLAKHVINQLLTKDITSRVVLAGRDLDALDRRANLARYTSANLGRLVEIETIEIDLRNVDKTAEALSAVKPDIIFMAASLQSWRRITELPKALFNKIDESQFGPWLPMHLALNLNLMQAIKSAGIKPITVNAAFPDAVNPILAKVGLAPTLGVGNVANIIPALTFGVSQLSRVAASHIQIRLIAQHYFTHFVPRYGYEGNGTYHLSADNIISGNRIEFDHNELFQMLSGVLKRQGGVEGQLLTASSASRVITAIAKNSNIVAHTPGPNGMPGGYPVRVNAEGATLDLPDDVSVAEAVRINEKCQQADGIDQIEADGTVWFAEREMNGMAKFLGYRVQSMALSDVWDRADEITRRFSDLRNSIVVNYMEDAA